MPPAPRILRGNHCLAESLVSVCLLPLEFSLCWGMNESTKETMGLFEAMGDVGLFNALVELNALGVPLDADRG
ncbi:hypothetical protein BofuT4_uP002520.1 [Botrytis cinerea T4]|uniref:Uncharacterized protein n=1 Tax=Botryotinia fuckeliana (strain T4) TaxID=999810 RepID=G2YMF7_BOTF4|nr:hypothetical protein BofuT4_uP002520.1 [Botrytis cinerea T4]